MAPSMLPGIEELKRMRDSGMSTKDIAEAVNAENQKLLGDSYREIGRSAVSRAFERAGEPWSTGETTKRVRYSDEIPWQVAKKDNRHYYLDNLRRWAQVNRGKELSIGDKVEYDRFVRALERDDVVIDYDPEEGWRKVPRRHGIDTGWIRLTDEQLAQRVTA